MATWPTGWQQTVLRAASIPVTQFALDVLSAWQKSTPTEPWTNNPLGMPALSYGVPVALNTPYGAFPTMKSFRDAFMRAMARTGGANVAQALSMAQSYSEAWRAIHALKWPSNSTESEYPIALMDMVQAAYTSKVQNSTRANPTTTGSTHAPPDVHSAMRQQAMSLHHAATTFNTASEAIAYLVKGNRGNG